jgi:hypothetical protein
MSAFIIVDSQESGSLWTPNIYSFTTLLYIYIYIYVCTIYTRFGIADHALTHVAHVTTAA